MWDLALYDSQQHRQFALGGLTTLTRTAEDDWHCHDAAEALHASDSLTFIPHESNCTLAVDCDNAVRLDTEQPIDRGTPIDLTDRLQLRVGTTHIEIVHRECSPSTRPLELLANDEHQEARDTQAGGPAPATVARWLEALATLHRWPANRSEFHDAATRFLVDPIGLDGAMMLRRDGRQWTIVASHLPHPECGVAFDGALVNQVAATGRTMLHSEHGPGQSLVLAPILDESKHVTHMLYGYRARHDHNGRRGVRYLEAQLVELLAKSVASSIERLAQEAEAARARVLLEQSFAPVVAAQVETDATALSGNQREVTVLFADLRGFAALCERIPTSDTYTLLNEVMDALTSAVMEQGGTLIDYYGDGLSAMWNAPLDQPQHALLACQAALAMQESLPEVSQRWQRLLDAPLRIGVGLHTGTVQVGNIGSSQRLKYGPRGSTVNLASRLEQASKRIGTPVVATRDVVQRLSGQLLDYRLCQADLPGVEQPVDVFAICPPTTSGQTLSAISQYEEALTRFEAGELDAAKQLLEEIVPGAHLPVRFLAAEIDEEHHRRLGRRASDHVERTAAMAISLESKG